MALLSALAPSYATEEVYQVLSDTALVDIVVPEDSALFDFGVMPLDFSNIDSTHLTSIYSAVGDRNSQSEGTVVGNLYRILKSLSDYLPAVVSIQNRLGYSNTSTLQNALGWKTGIYGSEAEMLHDWLITINNSIKSSNSLISSGNSLDTFLGVSTGTMLQSTGQAVNLPGVPTSIAEIERSGFLGLASLYRSVFQNKVFDATTSVGGLKSTFAYTISRMQQALYSYEPSEYLTRVGTVSTASGTQAISEMVRHGFMGLGRQLFDNQASKAWQTAYYDESGNKVRNDWVSTSIASILTTGFSQLSDPLADLAWVLANPADIELKNEANENTEAAGDAFVKPGGAGTPSVGNITDAAGISKDLTGALDTGVSAGQGLSAITDGENYSFFSADVQSDLNPFYGPSSSVSSYSDDDDFFSPYDPDAIEHYLEEHGF